MTAMTEVLSHHHGEICPIHMNVRTSPVGHRLPGGSDNKETVLNARYPGSIPGPSKSPGGSECQPTPVFCLRFHAQRSFCRLQSMWV